MYIDKCMHMYVSTYIYLCMYIYTYMYVYVCTHIYMYEVLNDNVDNVYNADNADDIDKVDIFWFRTYSFASLVCLSWAKAGILDL